MRTYKNKYNTHFIVYQNGKFIVRDNYFAYVGTLPSHSIEEFYSGGINYNNVNVKFFGELANTDLSSGTFHLISMNDKKICPLYVAEYAETQEYDQILYY